MYFLTTPLLAVKGIGPAIADALAARDLHTVKDLLLFVPLHYEDRSQKKMISELVVDELVTIQAEVVSSRNFYKGRRSIQSATVKDETGRLKVMWFNNPHVIARLVTGKKFWISGKLSERGAMIQPTIESLVESDGAESSAGAGTATETIHTGRLVPIYSSVAEVAPATLRKILKHILDNLEKKDDLLSEILANTPNLAFSLKLSEALKNLHFPDSEQHIIEARERLAVEELLALIQHSQELKKQWKESGAGKKIEVEQITKMSVSNYSLPFMLTNAQTRSVQEILTGLSSTVPMNRLLIGDVGSGKTAVAGIACTAVLASGFNAALVSPTRILAKQHFATFQKLFPQLKVELMTAKTSGKATEKKASKVAAKLASKTPTLYIGTHAILNNLAKIQPALLIYDEQHRFGVTHRSLAHQLKPRPHLLTLSATPIPRTLLLTIFSHLSVSVIDELPPGRQPIKTWVVPEKKRSDAYKWIGEQMLAGNSQSSKKVQTSQTLIVCPFIDPSRAETLENIAAASKMFEEIKKHFAKFRVSLLHGRTPKKEQLEITTELFEQKIDVLVTTPIIEVGVDLPAATIIVIEAAERFGLASLHQLRGRVGRAGQQAYCLLFTNSSAPESTERLKQFCKIHEGMKLAEMDLQRRGAGDIFGTAQHGFDELQFASWTNLELIAKAKQISEKIASYNAVIQSAETWQPLFTLKTTAIPLAN